MLPVIYANDEYYHVFNRGVARQPIFESKRDYNRVILTLDFYRFLKPALRLSKALLLELNEKEKFFKELKKVKKRVEVVAYCFMPNHFHFLLKQKEDRGISKFLSDFANSYTRYFNTRHKRVGPLFQGTFKGVRIETDEQLVHVSRYIHLNPIASLVISEDKLDDYSWSSLPEYLGKIKDGMCNKRVVLGLFKNVEVYRKFVYDQVEYAKRLEEMKRLTFE